MHFLQTRFNYLFKTTKGLILVAITMIGLETALFGMLSGPMAEFGVRDWVIKNLGMQIVQAEREGRIIILYHSIAMGVVAIETYMITSLVRMKPFYVSAVRVLITRSNGCSWNPRSWLNLVSPTKSAKPAPLAAPGVGGSKKRR